MIPFAMDGDWVTQLMWANLIGTQAGRSRVPAGGIREGGYAGNPDVVAATEYLKRLHTDGCVNKDAFSGDYNRAAAPFLDGQAAMIANGPWMVPDIEKAKIDAGYVPAPDGGLIVIPGEAGWASGAKDDAQREAVVAFMKFMTSDEQMLRKARRHGLLLADDVRAVRRAGQDSSSRCHTTCSSRRRRVDATYPHAKFATPQAFTDGLDQPVAGVRAGRHLHRGLPQRALGRGAAAAMSAAQRHRAADRACGLRLGAPPATRRRCGARPLAARRRTSPAASAATPGLGRGIALSLLPAVLLFTTFFIVPLGVVVVTSLSDWGPLELRVHGARELPPAVRGRRLLVRAAEHGDCSPPPRCSSRCPSASPSR